MQKLIPQVIFMEILLNFWRNNFVPCHWFKTDGLINLSAICKTQGYILQAPGPAFHRDDWVLQQRTRSHFCLVVGCELKGPHTAGWDQNGESPKAAVLTNVLHHAAEPWTPRFLKLIFGHMLTPKTEWWCWNKSPWKQHVTQQSLYLYTLSFLAPQIFIGGPSLLLVYMVRTSGFT